MRFPNVFVTATGTDVGKTIISAALLDAAPRHGHKLVYWKPVQTGGVDIDRHSIEAMLGRPLQCPLPTFSYQKPLSPDQAALADKSDPPYVVTLMERLRQYSGGPILVEGAGGIAVPLNQSNETWLEFMLASRLPVLLVASSGLGTINHTILSLQALDAADIEVLGVILNGPHDEANLQSLKRMMPHHRFSSFPEIAFEASPSKWNEATDKLWQFLEQSHASQPLSADWIEADKQAVWHPYTQHKTAPDPVPLVRGKGIYLYSEQGEELIDASSSWWTCSVGHGHPQIGAAIRRQQSRLDHSIFAGATHRVGVELAEALIGKSQGHMQRVFYTDNGSCAVEVALKMAAQSWKNREQSQRQLFLHFKGAYHGDTFGAMSVADREGLHKGFTPYLFRGVLGSPVTAHASSICPEGSQALDSGLKDLEALFATHGQELAGAVIEPWLQGASGMNVQELLWLQYLSRLCKTYKVPLILDEVFTGMGRTGDYFAFLRAGIEPDIVCIAKGLTGGNLPLAATLCREDIFEAFVDDDRSKALMHGHTFSGNPIACAAALATLQIFEKQALIANVLQVEERLKQWTEAQHLHIQNPRVLGAVAAWELAGTGGGDYFHSLAYDIPQRARRHGLLMRTLGNTMYFVPPLSILPQELDDALGRIEACIDEFLNEGVGTGERQLPLEGAELHFPH